MIEVTNYRVFRAAYMMRSLDQTRRYLCGVHIKPNGWAAGTNGHALVTGPCVEAGCFEPMTLVFCSALPARIKFGSRAVINLEKERLEIYDRLNYIDKVVPFMAIDATFPDIAEIVKPLRAKAYAERSGLSFNPKYAETIRAAFNAYYVDISFRGELEPILVHPDDPDLDGCFGVIMPCRSSRMIEEYEDGLLGRFIRENAREPMKAAA